MEKSNLPITQKNNLPDKIKRGIIKGGKILGSSLAFGASTVALVGTLMTMPALSLPVRVSKFIYITKIFEQYYVYKL